MSWHAELSDNAERQLKRLPRNVHQYLERAIDELEINPFRGDVIPLKGKQWQGRYRKCIGRYRIIFILHYAEHIVEVSAILLRNEHTYR